MSLSNEPARIALVARRRSPGCELRTGETVAAALSSWPHVTGVSRLSDDSRQHAEARLPSP
jgi:hypothetical protein